MTTADYERNQVLSTKEFKVVGTRPIRHDGADKVTGRAIYGADFDAAGLLHGKILRSPHAHAKIVSIDTSKAESLAGVKAVVTYKDFPQVSNSKVDLGEAVTELKWLRDNILASDKALYAGHAIAAVAATIKSIDITSNGKTQPVNRVDAIKSGVPSILYSTAGNHKSHLNPELITT